MNSPLSSMPKGTFDSKLAKVVFGDDVTRQRGPLSSEQQKECAEKLLRWLDSTPSIVIARHAGEVDRQLVSKLHGEHLRVVVKWFAENAASVGGLMPKVTRYATAMTRAVGYNSLYQPGPLERFRLALEMDNQSGSTTSTGT